MKKIKNYILLLIVSIFFISCGVVGQKRDYWIITLETSKVNRTHMDSSTAYHFYEVDKYSGFSDRRIDNTMSGYSLSYPNSWEYIKKELIDNAMSFRKTGEPVYFINEKTGKKEKIK